MVLFWQDGRRRLCEALDWSLYSVMGQRIFVPTESALVDYLKARPDVEFHLRNYRLREDMNPHREIDGARAADYGPDSGHLFCGPVRYDTVLGRVVCKGQ
jgi:hypothetical protein